MWGQLQAIDVSSFFFIFKGFDIGDGEVMRSRGTKRLFAIFAKLRMTKKNIFGQQLQLTTNQIVTKSRQYGFFI